MEYARLIKYDPPAAAGGITLAAERTTFGNVPIDLHAFEERKERAYAKLDIVQRYAKTNTCKRNYILQYFHEETDDNCNRCSSCLNPSDVAIKRTERQEFLRRVVLTLVSELDNRYGRTMIADIAIGATPAKIKQAKLTELDSFGEAGDFSRKEVIEEIDSCIFEQLLRSSREANPTISITDSGRSSLGKRVNAVPIAEQPKDSKYDQLLFDKIDAIRNEISSRENIPPSMVLDNSSNSHC